ncbi:type III PLP-dependent enzyme [Parvibaculum sp.]|uniref:type III PLP-dependent enzyme n=1 Tax=Parvibaculum sp. TaxID=2024848 RepID=UPI0025D5316A|nr:type III PLP-dependent enzyme [Parvibaculum sp.]
MRFQSVGEVVERLNPSYPVFVVFPDIVKARAQAFIEGFPGTVLYAVKCNPDPHVLRALYGAGIRHFDTASLPEIAKISELFPDAHCYFNHPVKSRGALESASDVYGIQHYVVDHISELNKLNEVVGRDITVEVRIATPKNMALYNLSSKFGAPLDDAVALLKEANARGCRTAIAFHVGSQCADPHAYYLALGAAADVARRAGVPLEYIDVGGGFPADYGEPIPPLEDFFDAIRSGRRDHGIEEPLLAEPGRALVADGCSILAQVQLRKGDDLYINDGVYGGLSEIHLGDLRPPVRAIAHRPKEGAERSVGGALKPFRIFGPTCDSLDVFRVRFELPDGIGEGDWIEFGHLGAYSIGMQSSFNGFFTDTVVQVAGAHDAFQSKSGK